MGKKEGTYIKSMIKLYERKKKLNEQMEVLDKKLLEVIKQERRFWIKTGTCTICQEVRETEWHHIISQNRCREIGREYLIHSRSNVVEVCRQCHDETTASLRRKAIDTTGGAKSVKNPNGPITTRQIDYITKLCDEKKHKLNKESLEGLTRGEASRLIDELKEMEA